MFLGRGNPPGQFYPKSRLILINPNLFQFSRFNKKNRHCYLLSIKLFPFTLLVASYGGGKGEAVVISSNPDQDKRWGHGVGNGSLDTCLFKFYNIFRSHLLSSHPTLIYWNIGLIPWQIIQTRVDLSAVKVGPFFLSKATKCVLKKGKRNFFGN